MRISNLIFSLFLSFIVLSGVALSQVGKSCCTDKMDMKTGTSGSVIDTNEVKVADVKTEGSKVCIVSGEKIEEGKAVQFKYLAKNYEFCCENCLKKFKAEPKDFIKEEMSCPVMGESASKDFPVVVDGTKYYMCCESCVSKFEKNSEKYLKRLEDE
jgi:YHS domain-containing protein